MLDRITPVILTLNESANIGRALSKLDWARDIVIVDSDSTDDTIAIAKSHPSCRIFSRAFDSHAAQWNFAISETAIGTEWILALDADYILSDALVVELSRLAPGSQVGGYEAGFIYCVDGRPLRATLYPPVTVLFRKRGACYWQDGHTQRVRIEGEKRRLAGHVFHDDRKSLDQWVRAQARYARIEAEKFHAPGWRPMRFNERLRQLRVVAPFAIFFYCLFYKLLILNGWPGIFYTLQRSFAELLLSLHLIRRDLSKRFG